MQNPRVKQTIRLRDRRERDKTDRFLIEGYRESLRAVDAGWVIEQLFTCPELFLGVNESTLIERILETGAEHYPCSERVFRKLSYRDRPDGLLAVAPQHHLELDAIKVKKPYPLYIVAEAIEKPGNLGTILRSADAVGADGCIVCDRCTDVHNPNVVRASVGTLFSVPVVETNGEKALAWLRKQGITILAATPDARVEFTEVEMCRPLAIAVGTEQLGLSKRWMEQADLQVRIPMNGIADSLNVAMATTLLMYEALRQKKQHG